MLTYKIKKEVLDRFVRGLSRGYELIAPVKTDKARFSVVKDTKEVTFERSYTPAKEFFFRKSENLYRYNKNRIMPVKAETKKRVFFGLRKCDLNAIRHQDIIFKDDPYYKAQREESILIGYHCIVPPSEYCFCSGLEDFFDLMIYEIGEMFYIEVGSDSGKKLIKSYFKPARKLTQEERKIRYTDRLKVHNISRFYDHPIWAETAELCLSCGACTTLCPTCYCFEIKDEICSPDEGIRCRQWSSCQVPGFTRVAGEFVFRKDRTERLKHRIYHQLDYSKKKYGFQLCVGCGRCIETCPTKIDFVKILNEIENE